MNLFKVWSTFRFKFTQLIFERTNSQHANNAEFFDAQSSFKSLKAINVVKKPKGLFERLKKKINKSGDAFDIQNKKQLYDFTHMMYRKKKCN